MRFEKGHKEATRQHILEVASKSFRRDGISASGIAGIMGEAGLTNGAFYPHFESKEVLVREATKGALCEQQQRLEQSLKEGRDLESVIRSYLNPAHLKDAGRGCPSAALLPEIARQPTPTRRAYEASLQSFVSALAGLLPDADPGAAIQRATAIFALMVGTLQIARAVPDSAHAKKVLDGGIQAALLLARASSA